MKEYSKKEVYEATLDFFGGDHLATDSCIKKYLLKDKDIFFELNPDHKHKRIAKEFSRIEAKYPNSLTEKEIYSLLKNYSCVIPGGSAMIGIGNNLMITSIANCFYIGSPHDSYGGICKTDQELVQVMKRRGGNGISLSSLRPGLTKVSNGAGSSTGAYSFAHRYSNSTRECAQNGRRGALMMDMEVRHPDIENFINLKANGRDAVTGANLSVKFFDDFLQAVIDESKYTLRWPVDAKISEAKITKEVNAKEIWNSFIDANWKGAEPGSLFWDNVKNHTISDCYSDVGFGSEGTNPCGEIVLSPYGACILISINLYQHIKKPYTDKAFFDFNTFEEVVRSTVRLADDMIDLEIEKVKKIIQKVENDPEPADIKHVELQLWKKILDSYIRGRRVGIGVVALADTLALCNIKYDSDEALEMCKKIFKIKNEIEYETTALLAKERGPFPLWDWEKEKGHEAIQMLPKNIQKLICENGRRNINLSTIPPTGTISILTRTSSGVEPVFNLTYIRRRKMLPEDEAEERKPDSVDEDGEKFIHYDVIHPPLQKWMEVTGKSMEESPWYGCTAHDIDWRYRIKLQGLIQKYIGHSISSTINLPEDSSCEELSDIYLTAWKMGCKGLTIYRDNCREGILLNEKSDKYKRKDMLECDIHYSTIQNNNWIILVGRQGSRPYEIFGGKRDKIEIPWKYKGGWIKRNGKLNNRRTYDLICGSLENEEDRLVIKDIASTFTPDYGSFTRIISLMLRADIPIRYICEQLYKDSENKDLFCFEKGIGRVLKKYIADGQPASGECEKCKLKLIYKDGCAMCETCGWSKCD